jgi:hypothetical protein
LAACSGSGHHAQPDAGVDAPADADNSLPIQPAAYAVPIGRMQQFVATGATSFTVTEAGGGTVTSTGGVATYVAPMQPGTYHLVASDGIQTGTATITVADFQLSLLAGQLGGGYFADGVGTAARFEYPGQVALAGADIYFGDYGTHTIRKFSTATNQVTTVAGQPGIGGVDDGLNGTTDSPAGIAVDVSQNVLYFSEAQEHMIRRLDLSTGMLSTIAGQAGQHGAQNGAGTAATFFNPLGLAYDAASNFLYVAEFSNCDIRLIDLSNQNTVFTYAGTATICTGVDSATAPTFAGPSSLMFNNARLYVADQYAIRRVDFNSATTVAGSAGTNGYVNNSVGTQARFGRIEQMVSDGAGKLYVADFDYEAIRTFDVNSTAVGTLVDNGTANLQSLCGPVGLAFVGGGVYETDSQCSSINFVSPAGVAAHIAGQFSHGGENDGPFDQASFSYPTALTADAGHVYVADYSNCLVRTLDLGAQVTSLLAGSGSCGHSDGTGASADLGLGVYGLTLDSAGTIYAADYGDNGIRAITVPGGVVTTPFSDIMTFAPAMNNGTGTASTFNGPNGAVLVNGVLYVADTGNHLIRAIDIASTVTTTFAGGNGMTRKDGVGTAAGFGQLSGITTDGATLYVTEYNYPDPDAIRAIDIASGSVTTLAGGMSTGKYGVDDGIGGAATFESPGAIAWDGEHSLYVAQPDESVIRRIYIPTGAVSTFAGALYHDGVALGSIVSAQPGDPLGLVVGSSGTLYISVSNENSVLQLVQQ